MTAVSRLNCNPVAGVSRNKVGKTSKDEFSKVCGNGNISSL